MRTSLVAGNWKMNLTSTEAAALVEGLLRQIEARTDVDVVVCPSFVSLSRVRELLRDTHVKLGAQDCFWLEEGAYTGQISPKMLASCGVDFCVIGHSETRGRFGKVEVPGETLTYFGELDRTINLKLQALLYRSITPILCVGETEPEREAGKTDDIIASQLLAAICGIDPSELYSLVVAYEPVWAIGTGKTCDAAEANRVCGMIRATIAGAAGQDLADDLRVLYGGSIKPSNSDELFKMPEIDGGLVGGASLDADGFARIVMSA